MNECVKNDIRPLHTQNILSLYLYPIKNSKRIVNSYAVLELDNVYVQIIETGL